MVAYYIIHGKVFYNYIGDTSYGRRGKRGYFQTLDTEHITRC